MTITAIFGFIKTLVQIYPMVKETINGVFNLWVMFEAEELREQYNLKQNKLSALRKAIAGAVDDKERIALSIVLHDIERM